VLQHKVNTLLLILYTSLQIYQVNSSFDSAGLLVGCIGGVMLGRVV